jgi:hypothetical protein
MLDGICGLLDFPVEWFKNEATRTVKLKIARLSLEEKRWGGNFV